MSFPAADGTFNASPPVSQRQVRGILEELQILVEQAAEYSASSDAVVSTAVVNDEGNLVFDMRMDHYRGTDTGSWYTGFYRIETALDGYGTINEHDIDIEVGVRPENLLLVLNLRLTDEIIEYELFVNGRAYDYPELMRQVFLEGQ
jgi:hypothetical protein